MPERPRVTVVMTTYFPPGEGGASRQRAAIETLASWKTHLRYDGEIALHVADDGSGLEHWPALLFGWDDRQDGSRQERHGVGASLNAGCKRAFARGDIALYAVDDWLLTADLDITPWVDLLMRGDGVCMVRLGPPHPDLSGTVMHLGDLGWALRLDRHHFAFGHRPALYHPRMFEAYGEFAEDVNAYECERLYNERFCSIPGPDIVLALPHPWMPHPGSIELADINPRYD